MIGRRTIDEEPARRLVGTSWVVKRTGLDRSTVRKAAKSGRLPGFFLLGEVWRFDPDDVEAWIAARSNQSQPTETAGCREPTRHVASPTAVTTQGRAGRASRQPESTPPLVVIFPNAAHRGINDLPSEATAKRPARRRRSAQH